MSATVPTFEIRPYRPADREAVRHICFVTGYMGDPVDWAWRDEESFADVWTSYYTDREPESALVAERDGRVVGYLLGCRDTAQAGSTLAPLRRHLLRRGLLVRPGTAPLLWRGAVDAAVAVMGRALPPTEVRDPRWPAHLHIDLLAEARGAGVGSRLVHEWLDRLRRDGVAGCHLGTYAENTGAIAFFERMGFRREGPPQPVPGMRSPAGARHHTQIMVRDLRRPPAGAPEGDRPAGGAGGSEPGEPHGRRHRR